jgi:hypothetical protein
MNWMKFSLAVLLLPAAALADTATLSHSLPAWMTGAWSYQSGEEWGDEYWTPPRGGIMIGAARIGKANDLVVWESTRIAYDEDGKLAFWAMPRGVPATKFALVSASERAISFANPENEYPQLIRYWRDGKALNAEISMMDGSKPYRFSYQAMGQ